MAKLNVLTAQDVTLLLEWGYLKEELQQIDKGAKECIYEEYCYGEGTGKFISREEVINTIGRGDWLSGIGRAAFHATAYRGNEKKALALIYANGDVNMTIDRERKVIFFSLSFFYSSSFFWTNHTTYL
jgi:hypothetical protein